MPIYNVHIHVFSAGCAPKRFLEVAHLGLAAPVAKYFLETRFGQWLIHGIKKISGAKASRMAKMASFASIGTMSLQKDVFENILQFYPAGTRFVVLTLNMDHMGAGPCDLDFQTQIDQVVALRRLYPDQCLPFLCVDPRTGSPESIMSFVRRQVGPGLPFVGIKVYPSLGYLPTHPSLQPLWAFCEAHQLPIMTHCTPSGVYYLGDLSMDMIASGDPEMAKKWTDLRRKNNPANTDVFLTPGTWNPVLARHPGLKLCFAHMGGVTQIEDATNATNWFAGIQQLMRQHPNIYTDVSYTLADEKVGWKAVQSLLGDELLRQRVLFGTDYFMTEQEAPEKKLAVTLSQHLQATNPTGWALLMRDNPERFLQSDFYQP